MGERISLGTRLYSPTPKTELKALIPEDACASQTVEVRLDQPGTFEGGAGPCSAPAMIGPLAAALAKAQSEIENPQKSLTATIESPFPREGQRSFRYAPLSAGLDIVRKCLGQHEIATIQATTIDRDSGLIRLTTTLVPASGEWSPPTGRFAR